MLFIVQSQLAIDLNCSIADLNDEKDSIIFVEAKENPGRRPFPRKKRYFEIVSMGKSIVVSATSDWLSIAKKQMQGNVTSFSNALIYDTNLPWQTELAVLAKQDGEIVGVAGASKTCEKLWQIGIDVLPAYHNLGLASYLVNRLTFEILERGEVPGYDVIASNLASQRVAQRSGYLPAWVSDWRCNFEGFES